MAPFDPQRLVLRICWGTLSRIGAPCRQGRNESLCRKGRRGKVFVADLLTYVTMPVTYAFESHPMTPLIRNRRSGKTPAAPRAASGLDWLRRPRSSGQ